MKIEISIGELVDKYTILTIKSMKINNLEKRFNVIKELLYLSAAMTQEELKTDELTTQLLHVNNELWSAEDAIRECEKAQDFSEKFVKLARSVYKLNDKRANIKKKINMKYVSNFIEEKSYEEY